MKKHALSLLVLSSFYAVSVQCSSKAPRRHSSHSSEGDQITEAINAHDIAALKKIPKAALTGRLGFALTKFTLENKTSGLVLAHVAGSSKKSEVLTALIKAQTKSHNVDEKRKKTAIAAILSKTLPHLSE